ncbi:Nif3-like dinuclear metal center hexameric protein [Adlercreutzia faecimuris]|uniref:GTP cyclohydrolase 1 type 2 homolog n=1 Tax=Adlercreutzia faecimuris TaxID=2897341 RepID=A0ABS9WIK1_9ACTN|nr:Nif3-like dinuclear metal center hexameric protein [Adlercreutzia sp. JBNU-10]MCI2242708.1 Nif3-like dinuclear metal center hexameric protein [Adlercreutzia sp. JBNU-10]
MAFFTRRDKDATDGAARAAGDAGALAERPSGALAKQGFAMTVGGLESALLREFPAADAESWDRTGVLVGERALPVRKVAVALDPTVAAIHEAARDGANVLVTHHPAFLAAPDAFAPEASDALCPGAGVWAAIQSQVALMDFHTALDVSPRAARVLPGMLGLAPKGAFLEPLAGSKRKGYGQVCAVRAAGEEPETLGRLAARCTSVFGRQPRVWGDFDAPVRTAATATGSAGSLGRAALAQGVDCLICGEVKYHEALALAGAGLAVIELGHDVSELPLVAVLAEALLKAGVPDDRVIVIDQADNWAYPEAIRI